MDMVLSDVTSSLFTSRYHEMVQLYVNKILTQMPYVGFFYSSQIWYACHFHTLKKQFRKGSADWLLKNSNENGSTSFCFILNLKSLCKNIITNNLASSWARHSVIRKDKFQEDKKILSSHYESVVVFSYISMNLLLYFNYKITSVNFLQFPLQWIACCLQGHVQSSL